MKSFCYRTVAGAFVALMGFAATASAQVTTGSVAGRVTDESGEPIEGAQVQVKNTQTNLLRARLTNADGRYVILGLEVGSAYSVTVRRIGLQSQSQDNQSVALGTTTRVDFSLKQAATNLQGIKIIATTDPVIAPSKTGVGVTVSDSLLHRMPTLNRNFTDMVALTPQVSLNGAGLSGGGVNNRYNTIQIDGASETDLFGLGSTGQPGGQAGGKSIGIESVKQYQVLLSPYDVRQGMFAGALINAVTKSGSNEWHGSIYDAFRSQSLTRTEPYLSDYHQTQYGFTLGGPIVKDKIFFFVNPEYQLENAPSSGCYIGLAGCNLQQADLNRFVTLASAVRRSHRQRRTGVHEEPADQYLRARRLRGPAVQQHADVALQLRRSHAGRVQPRQHGFDAELPAHVERVPVPLGQACGGRAASVQLQERRV